MKERKKSTNAVARSFLGLFFFFTLRHFVCTAHKRKHKPIPPPPVREQMKSEKSEMGRKKKKKRRTTHRNKRDARKKKKRSGVEGRRAGHKSKIERKLNNNKECGAPHAGNGQGEKMLSRAIRKIKGLYPVSDSYRKKRHIIAKRLCSARMGKHSAEMPHDQSGGPASPSQTSLKHSRIQSRRTRY